MAQVITLPSSWKAIIQEIEAKSGTTINQLSMDIGISVSILKQLKVNSSMSCSKQEAEVLLRYAHKMRILSE